MILKKWMNRFNITEKDLHNLFDLFYIITTPKEFGMDLKKTLKLNKMDRWFNEFFTKLDKYCLPELWRKE